MKTLASGLLKLPSWSAFLGVMAVFIVLACAETESAPPIHVIEPAQWIWPTNLKDLVRDENTLKGSIAGSPAYMFSKIQPSIEAETVQRIVFKLRADSDLNGQIFWITESDPEYNDKKYTDFAVERDGGWHEYEILTSKLRQWKESITGFRLGFAGKLKGTPAFEVAAVRFCKTEGK